MSIAHLNTACQEEVEADFVPPGFVQLVANGREPETAADIVTTTIQATRKERYGELAGTLTTVLGWTYGPDIA